MENITDNKKNYSLTTFGCTFNKADSLKMQNLLLKHGYNEVSIDKSEIIILNTCAVKNSTHNKIISLLSNLIHKINLNI